MADKELRQAERAWNETPTKECGRRLHRLLLRNGMKEKALKIRSGLGYAEEISALPRPTKQQCKNFAEYVASAHSWYKHLSAKKPTSFYFYLGPCVAHAANGEVTTKEDCWHYSDKPTDVWLKEFGHWAYWIFYGSHNPQNTKKHPTIDIRAESGDTISVPEEFLISAPVTAYVHSSFFKEPKECFKMNKPSPHLPQEQKDYCNTIRNNTAAGKWDLRGMLKAMQKFLARLDTA